MDANSVGLPPGFQLDEAPTGGLPDGFVLDRSSIGADVLKSGGIGLAKGGIGLAGMGGDIREAIASGINAGSKALGYEIPSVVAGDALRALPVTGALMSGPTSGQLQGAIEGVTGKFYEPQTSYGKIAQTVGELAPAVIGGPESLVAKLATRVAAPAAAITATQQVTDNPIAQAGAGVAASVLAHRAPKAAAGTTGADLEAAANQSYADVHNMGLQLKAKPVEALATQIEQKLIDKGVTPRNAKPIYEALDTLKNPPAGAVITSRGFDNLRKEMVAATQSADGSMRTGGGTVIRALDDYLANLPQSHVISGDAQAAAAKFKEARDNYKAMIRMQIAEGKQELGGLNASTAHSGQNVDNAMRQSFKQMIRPDKYGKSLAQKEGFNSQEIEAIRDLAKANSMQNMFRWAGKLAPTDAGKIAGNIALGHMTGGATIPLTAAALAAKKISDRMTLNKTQSLLDMIASRSPAGQQQAMLNAVQQALQPRRLNRIQKGLLTGALTVPPGLLPFDQLSSLPAQ